ncbi:hypothetical protein BROUX41_003173 [Berkeleyomyces rouxiae]|uniref:uncharacterized protein n=1 Tax=Berkeleyomyces rouxiae TaxID=2035830 RepID=UPI003B78A024
MSHQPPASPKTNQKIANLRNRTSSSMSIRSTSSVALSQRAGRATLTVRNAPSRPASRLSISKHSSVSKPSQSSTIASSDTPSAPSNSTEPQTTKALEAELWSDPVIQNGIKNMMATILNNRSFQGTVVPEELPEEEAEASIATEVSPSSTERTPWVDVPMPASSQREERINRHASNNNETSGNDTDEEEIMDPRMFIDVPGLRLPVVEDMRRRYTEHIEKKKAKEQVRTLTNDSIAASTTPTNYTDDAPSHDYEELANEITPSTTIGSPPEELAIPEPLPAPTDVNTAVATDKSKPKANATMTENTKVENDDVSAGSFHKNIAASNASVSPSPVSEVVKSTPDMDWEIVWMTTSSFKAIRPRVSRSEPSFTRVLDRIRDILEGGEPFLPAYKRHDLEELDDFQYQPESAYGSLTQRLGNDDMSIADLSAEMDKIIDIVKRSNQAQSGGFSNYEVHRSVLDLAFGNSVLMQDLDRAQICYQFLVDDTEMVVDESQPLSRNQLVKKQAEQDFMRGYGIGLDPEKDEKLRMGVKQLLKRASVPSITPSMYRRMRNSPMGVFVGSASLNDSVQHMRTRLFVWAASCFKRFDLLKPKHRVPSLPVLPLISAEGDTWRLFFACRDDTEQVVMVGPVVIGSTAMVQETYRLVAVLQVLARWLQRDFRSWIGQLISSQ